MNVLSWTYSTTSYIVGGLLLVIGSFSIVSFFPGSASAVEKIPSAVSKIVEINEDGSRLFILHGDNTVSIYDAERKSFLVSRKRVFGLTNGIMIYPAPSGRKFLLVNGGVAAND